MDTSGVHSEGTVRANVLVSFATLTACIFARTHSTAAFYAEESDVDDGDDEINYLQEGFCGTGPIIHPSNYVSTLKNGTLTEILGIEL
jgi:hypothetical protein